MRHLSSLISQPPPDAVRTYAHLFDVNKIGTDVSAWVGLNSDGSVRQDVSYSTICHGGIGSADWVVGLCTWREDTPERYNYCRVASQAYYERFVDWYVNRSWCSEIIVPVKDRVILVSGDLPSNVLVAALTVHRTAREHGHYVKRMFDIVDHFGCSEDLAFAIAFLTDVVDTPTINRNHCSLACTGDHKAYIRNFLERTVVKTHAPFKESAEYRGGITSMWGGGGAAYSADIAGFVDSFPKANVATGKVVVPNPFAPVVKDSGRTLSQKALYELIPTIMEYYDATSQRQAA